MRDIIAEISDNIDELMRLRHALAYYRFERQADHLNAGEDDVTLDLEYGDVEH